MKTRVKKKISQFRKYDDNYLDLDFTYITIDNVEHLECVICLKVLTTNSMLSNKLKRYSKVIIAH